MDLLEQTEKDLKDIKINENYDQHFLVDEIIIERMAEYAEINKDDIIFEIGPGTGNITKLISRYCKKIIAVEIDHRFKSLLLSINNLELWIGNAFEVLSKKDINFNKIVSNLPFQVCDRVLDYLNSSNNVTISVLIVPRSFYLKSKDNVKYSNLNIELVEEIPRDSFYPEPDTNSVIIRIRRKD
jgi:16S rRNA A1518/A1519 N6-dimethyltransferase RsmA/KsgA/DIM1 with predicted DNA glycosylase/AP lyase activity